MEDESKPTPNTDEERLIKYINSLNRRILSLEADKRKTASTIDDLSKKVNRFINLVEDLRSEYKKLKSVTIIIKEKISNLNLSLRAKNK